ncbi:MAG TPA: translation initiation factor IF-3, partial [Proteobacteria bacterium]|nr:translation initiation factor IF-3 [Pseudomonadota bacterium]
MEGNKIKVTVRFRGREIVHTDRGNLVLKKLLELLDDVAAVESHPKMEGRTMIMILAPVA